MPPLLFPDSSRAVLQKRSALFSLCFQQDTFTPPRLPSPLHFPIIDNPHHTSYFVNQRIKNDVQRNSSRAASPPAKEFWGMRGGGSGEGRRRRLFPKGPFSLPPAHHSHLPPKKGKRHVRLPDHLPRACRRKPHTHPHGSERPPALRMPSHSLSGSGSVHDLEAPGRSCGRPASSKATNRAAGSTTGLRTTPRAPTSGKPWHG